MRVFAVLLQIKLQIILCSTNTNNNWLVEHNVIYCYQRTGWDGFLVSQNLLFPRVCLGIIITLIYRNASIGRHQQNGDKRTVPLALEQGIDRVLGELARCGNQFVGDIKEYFL